MKIFETIIAVLAVILFWTGFIIVVPFLIAFLLLCFVGATSGVVFTLTMDALRKKGKKKEDEMV